MTRPLHFELDIFLIPTSFVISYTALYVLTGCTYILHSVLEGDGWPFTW
jgi:hypothetical protein